MTRDPSTTNDILVLTVRNPSSFLVSFLLLNPSLVFEIVSCDFHLTVMIVCVNLRGGLVRNTEVLK